MTTTAPTNPSLLHRFIASESASGILLMVAAAAALLIANSPLAAHYHHLIHLPLGHTLSAKLGEMTPHLWINDGLMAAFFLLVGLEIKREMSDGRLSSWSQRRLPAVPAIFGMAVPAAIFAWMTHDTPGQAAGWAIPAATDIAFALGVLALLGKRAPMPLKVLLLSVAIIDDMGAVAIIALFYTESLHLVAFGGAVIVALGMLALNRARVTRLWPYLVLLPLLWYFTLLSGIHATLAGVVGALLIPYRRDEKTGRNPLLVLEHSIAIPVALIVMPIFGFANAGVSVPGLTLQDLLAPIPLGVAAGLFVGKQIGVFGGVALAVKSGFASKPDGVTWAQIYGVALLCGIGFTMSLFISGLAYPLHPDWADEAKLGILLGSVASALAGALVLACCSRPAPR